MRFEVLKDHKCDLKNPIKIIKGERVRIGKYSDVGDGWLNWVYSNKLDGKSEGWIPIQLLFIEGEEGVVLDDYSAQELTAKKGDLVLVSHDLNGWIWCEKVSNGEIGWLPKENIRLILSDEHK